MQAPFIPDASRDNFPPKQTEPEMLSMNYNKVFKDFYYEKNATVNKSSWGHTKMNGKILIDLQLLISYTRISEIDEL